MLIGSFGFGICITGRVLLEEEAVIFAPLLLVKITLDLDLVMFSSILPGSCLDILQKNNIFNTKNDFIVKFFFNLIIFNLNNQIF